MPSRLTAFRWVLCPGYVLGMGSIEGLHHLNAGAAIVRERHRECGKDLRAESKMLAGLRASEPHIA